ncbi:MAG: transposase [Acidobacteriota bacterium]|nr:transposase [Acidobacteriota bacterium]
MNRNKAYKIRIYPNQRQTKQINRTIGCCRFVFNQMLAERKEVYERLKADIESLKSYQYKTEKQLKAKFPFLAASSSRALQQSRINLERAYQNFFAKRSGFPKFKAKKKSAESYREPQVNNFLQVRDGRIKLLKLGWVKLAYLPKDFTGQIKSVTVSRTKTNEYYVSILTEQELVLKKRESDDIIGLDLGLTAFCITSKGEFFQPIQATLRRLEKKVKFWHRKLSRQVKGSQRRERTRLKLNKVYEQMRRLQNHFGWHLANKLCRENQAISLESLAFGNLLKNRQLSHSIHLTNWGEFLSKLKQKAALYGTRLHFAPKFYASSKTCYNCKERKTEMSLAEREYECLHCGYIEQRDVNAALNLRNLIENSSEYGENRHREIIRPKKLKFDFRGSFNEVLTKERVHIWA